jgi:hypothetical protein
MRSEYKDLVLELVSLEEKTSRTPKRPLMEGEKKDDGTGDPFKLSIEESLTQQRNEMMDNFTQILRRLPTDDASSSSRGIAPFKVQINLYFPIFEGQIDADVVDKWLNLLEGYFSIHNFLNREKITFALLKAIPHVRDWWETFCEQTETVRKTGPRSNKIKQMQKQNTEDTQYKRDTDLRGSPSVGYVHQRNCQVLPLLLSSK